MGGAAKKRTKSPAVRVRWSDAFSRTAGFPVVFTVHWSHMREVEELLGSLGLPTHHQGGLFSTWYWATPLLDGYVLENSTEGFPAGRLPSGLRVVGVRPLRLLCHLLNFTQPRKLKVESTVPREDALRAELKAQQTNRTESLRQDLRSMLFAGTKSDLALLVFELYGLEGLPKDLPSDAALKIPGPGEWGHAGLSLADARCFQEEGVDVESAAQWRQMVSLWAIPRLVDAGVTLDEARKWHAAGVDVAAVPSLKRVGAPIEEVVEWTAAGGHAGNYASAYEQGVSTSQVRPFMEMGYPDLQAVTLVKYGVSVGELRELDEEVQPKPWERQFVTRLAELGVDRATVRRWLDLGINVQMVARGVHAGVSLTDLQELAAAGKSVEAINLIINKRLR